MEFLRSFFYFQKDDRKGYRDEEIDDLYSLVLSKAHFTNNSAIRMKMKKIKFKTLR